MKNLSLLILSFISFSYFASAQYPGGRGNFGNNPMMNTGHFYGKVVDSLSGKPIEFASVQLWANKKDTVTKAWKPYLLTGMITESNGDFSFENLPVLGKYTIKINFIGYNNFEEKISFDIDMKKMTDQAQSKNKDVTSMINAVDKDLGNIKLSMAGNVLGAVVVEGSPPVMELKFDKKVFNVEKNITTTGGTAEDVLRNVPSVNVDIDGNVTMRNAAPQIFVDGKPTTLTLDQIPAEAIESVELITNPSAKYDASGGGGGILNIVMKKARKVGYNGNVNVGMDMRGKLNLGGDINSRQGKFNVFMSARYHQRKSEMTGETERYNLIASPTGSPLTNVFQNDAPISTGYFAFLRGGFDYFLDNRNTITISGMLPTGSFTPTDVLHEETDTISPAGASSFYTRYSNTKRNFNNPGGSLQYKHIYPKAGREWTADLNYNASSFTSSGNFLTQYNAANGDDIGSPIRETQIGSGTNKFYTAQTDYVDPIGDNMKIETGLRAAVRNFVSNSNSFFLDSVNDEFPIPGLNNNYNYTDQVYAGYVMFSEKIKKISYQAGIRVESSQYNGTFLDSSSSKPFQNQYPLSIFPSGNVTYSLNDKGDFQFSFSRRVNRPNIFQLMPFINYSDSLNLSEGNPDLKPEFTDLLEFSYLRNFDRFNNVLVSLWYRNTTDLITHYLDTTYSPTLDRDVIINTYENANSATAYGLELTGTNSITRWFSLTSNVNFYNSNINGTNLQNGLTNQQFSWFGKLNGTFKLPKNFSVQLIGNYQSKTSLPQNTSGGGQMFGGGGSQATVQGYQKPTYGVDAALKYEFLKNKAASLTLNGSDIFKTRETQIYNETAYFNQYTTRTRDPQFFRLTFSYRFGKMDVSLFKRKDTKVNTEGLDSGQDQ